MNRTNAIKIIKILKNTYPEAKCSLNFSSPFEMVVAVMLSAQCTDERVNKTTPALFKRYTSIEAFAKADLEELENYNRICSNINGVHGERRPHRCASPAENVA